ncbi:MAG TPA: aldo/keto reductase [bacterium]|nr:aldo/keto reductase [bacterium]
MIYRKLGRTNVQLSIIGHGTWSAGGGEWIYGWGPQDDADTINAIHASLDNGVNWIDTAAVYGLGRAEEVTGRALEGRRKSVFVATKCGRVSDDNGKTIRGSLSAKSIKSECEMSLKRLRTDYIDLYQIHWPVQDMNETLEGWAAVNELIKEGKVRYAGVSNFDVTLLKALSAIAEPVSLQPPYSLLRRDIEKELLPYCVEKNIGVLAYSPLEKGLLTGKITKEYVESLEDTDHRKRDDRFNEPRLSEIIEYTDRLKKIAEGRGITVSALALAWVTSQKGVTAAIAGARNREQAEANAKAGDVR